MKHLSFAALFCAAALLSACGGGGSDSSPSPDPGTDPVDNTEDDLSGDQPVDEGADSGLIPTPVAVPQGPAPSAADALISSVGAARALANAADPAVVIEAVDNHSQDTGADCQQLGAQYASCSVINLHIKSASGSLNDDGWKLYFHSIRRVLRIDSDEFTLSHVKGDLYYLKPVAGFAGFSGSTVKSIKLLTEFAHLHVSDFMPNYWLSRPGQSAQLIANTAPGGDFVSPITGDNQHAFIGEGHALSTAGNRYAHYDITANTFDNTHVVPTPVQTTASGGTLSLGHSLSIDSSVLSSASIQAINSRLANIHGGSGSTPVSTQLDTAMNSGAYHLNVGEQSIAITGGSEEAVFNALQSVLGLVQPGVATIPQVDITDEPRFDYRGMHVDVARNFFSTAQIKKLIDQMAAYKLNRLHMHLSDDEGWRLAIAGLQELTDVGSRRGFTSDSNGDPVESSVLLPQLGSGPAVSGGHYSRAQFVDLLRYAAARYVQVIPEFDMPGHARAAVAAMRVRAANAGAPGDTRIRIDDPLDESRYLTVQFYNDGTINPCVQGTYDFIETVVTDVASMYAEAGMTLDSWHMGGDEARNIFRAGGIQDFNTGSPVSWRGFADTSLWDLPWERSPRCRSLISSNSSLNTLEDLERYFVSRVSQIVADAGISTLYAFQDILSDIDSSALATERAGTHYWVPNWDGGYQRAYEWPSRGYDTVITSPDFLYFDHPYDVDSEEPGYYWATRYTDTRSVFSFAPENLPQNADVQLNREGFNYTGSSSHPTQQFQGMQGQLWGETVRTDERFDYMVFPRLLALAERAWHRADWEQDYTPGKSYSGNFSQVTRSLFEQDWARFANTVGMKELAKLDAAGIRYRVPTAGAILSGGTLQMNSPFPGLPLEYSIDGTGWQSWDENAAPVNAVSVRLRSASGSRAGRATSVIE